eukprot:TRINITY_DN123630_c0_g1_i1.p1 TRINITY_DN123630_c0_g1~~TRINITY_DN123630_c0_g1_i1.p1  ORF type:complete len:535 (-),score=70.81 TRINITY_DN123630_c0_g1_i1:133-1737(-)
MCEGHLPAAVSTEILRRYADVLRVGSLNINGELVTWDTSSSTEVQLQNFCASFCGRLRKCLPDLAEKSPSTLGLSAYWFCKLVSINYALIEVVLMVKRRVGVLCTIETRDQETGEPLVDYIVKVRPEGSVHVSLIWKKKHNIVYCNPKTAMREVKGTLSCIEAEFTLPPAAGYAPAYSLQMRLKKSLTKKLVSRIVCGGRMPGGKDAPTAIAIDEPLRSDAPLESMEQLASWQSKEETGLEHASNVPEGHQMAGASLRSLASSPSSPTPRHGYWSGIGDESSSPALARSAADTVEGASRLRMPSISIETRGGTFSTSLTASSVLDVTAGSPELPLGRLRVDVVRATGLELSGFMDGRMLYATCSVGTRVAESRAVAECNDPEWRASLSFPLIAQDLRQEVVIKVFESGGPDLRFRGRACIPVSTVLGHSAPVAIAARLEGSERASIHVELQLLLEHTSDSLSENDTASTEADELASEDDECVVTVGSVGSYLRESASNLIAEMSPFKIQVRGAPQPSRGFSFWCTRACTTKAPD